MSIQEVISISTWNPAQIIQRPELGHLSVGAEADVTLLKLEKGNFGFIDTQRKKMMGTQKLNCELTLRAGEVVYDLNGLASPLWNE
jgi:dihydroorotase